MITYKISIPDDRGIKYTSFKYPGGEIQARLNVLEIPLIQSCDELRVTCKITDGEIGELAQLTDAVFVYCTTFNKVLILPYLPYARADRRFVEGDSFGLKAFSKLVNSLGYSRIETFDAHSIKSQGLILGLENISPLPFIKKAISDIRDDDLTLLLPDAGAHRYNLSSLKLPILQAGKKRDPGTGKLLSFDVPYISTKKVLIVDDICDGGGTFKGIASEIINQSISPFDSKMYLFLYVTHGIFSKGLEPLKAFERIYTTNTFTNDLKLEKIHTESVC